MKVVLGNRHAAVARVDEDTGTRAMEPMTRGKRATTIEAPDEDSLLDVLTNVTHTQGIWAHHADENAKPAWVASESPALSAIISEHFGGIEVRELEGGKPSARKAVQAASSMYLTLMLFLGFMVYRMTVALKTNAGNDVQAAQMAGSASATAVLKWVALTANTTAPSASDTTLTAEIATASGGLIRKAGTYAHTTGAASYTITTTFTANGNDSLPVTIGKRGIFDASSSGNMGFTTLLSPTATISASGDSLTLTDTISL